MKEYQNSVQNDNKKKPGPRDPGQDERAVVDTKQPSPTNQPLRKTDPSSHSFDEEE